MSLPNNLIQNGRLEDFSAVELLKEASAASLGGTFHFELEPQKIAVYLSDGEVIFAASNVRGHRLASKLLQWKAVAENDLAELINLPEPELVNRLIGSNKLIPEMAERYQAYQITEILMAALSWTNGEWIFNPLIRARENMRVRLELPKVLIEAARLLPADLVKKRFEADESTFDLSPAPAPNFNLSPEEAYLLSRFERAMSAETAATICGLPYEKTCQVMFSLWLGGVLRRFDHQIAFDAATIELIQSAKIAPSQKVIKVETKTAKVTPVVVPNVVDLNVKVTTVSGSQAPPNISPEPEISEEEQVKSFLQRVETAKSFYQILDVAKSTDIGELKKAYFKLAKQFHPDKFHSIGGETHSRLQYAFTQLAQAYETLKDPKNRELYDFKLSKQLSISGDKSEISQFTAEEIYQSGVKELQNGNYNEAVAYLQRAVQLAPNIAEYQAKLGQALAVNPKFRHQAEERMQQAIKLENKNPEWRLLLAEYYIAVGLNKRAEGELNRLLSIYPNHPLAQQMFASLR